VESRCGWSPSGRGVCVCAARASGSNARFLGGNEARAATAARNGSPRGPGVLTGAGSLRKPSSARSCRVDGRAGAEESSGNSANLRRSVQIGILAVNDLAKSEQAPCGDSPPVIQAPSWLNATSTQRPAAVPPGRARSARHGRTPAACWAESFQPTAEWPVCAVVRIKKCIIRSLFAEGDIHPTP
jgi:hypothetical protein